MKGREKNILKVAEGGNVRRRNNRKGAGKRERKK